MFPRILMGTMLWIIFFGSENIVEGSYMQFTVTRNISSVISSAILNYVTWSNNVSKSTIMRATMTENMQFSNHHFACWWPKPLNGRSFAGTVMTKIRIHIYLESSVGIYGTDIWDVNSLRPRVAYICVSKLTITGPDNGLSAPSHYLNQWWNIVN